MDAWWSQFKHYLRDSKNVTAWDGAVAEGNFSALLSDFLFSRVGSKYQKNFHFGDQLICNRPAPNITVSGSNYYKQTSQMHRSVEGSALQFPCRNIRSETEQIPGKYCSWCTVLQLQMPFKTRGASIITADIEKEGCCGAGFLLEALIHGRTFNLGESCLGQQGLTAACLPIRAPMQSLLRTTGGRSMGRSRELPGRHSRQMQCNALARKRMGKQLLG